MVSLSTLSFSFILYQPLLQALNTIPLSLYGPELVHCLLDRRTRGQEEMGVGVKHWRERRERNDFIPGYMSFTTTYPRDPPLLRTTHFHGPKFRASSNEEKKSGGMGSKQALYHGTQRRTTPSIHKNLTDVNRGKGGHHTKSRHCRHLPLQSCFCVQEEARSFGGVNVYFYYILPTHFFFPSGINKQAL